jgi:glycine betaine catabolism B
MTQTNFYKCFAWINCAVPGLMLAWDASQGQLGANPVNDAIRTTGLIALSLLTLSLLITPLRWITKWNQLIALRRPLGLSGFYYACIHLCLYLGLDRALNLRSALEEVLTRRYLQIGICAVMLMVPLAITSTDAMVRRLGAKRWKLLHRLAYVAIAGGVLHYFLLVKSDVRQPLAFAGVVTVLFAARGVAGAVDLRRSAIRTKDRHAPTSPAAPKRAFYRGELQVIGIFQETPDVKTFRLAPPGGGTLPFVHQPGQYLTLQQQVDGARVTRCYTIASPPSRNAYCEITVKRETQGLSSRNLHDQLRRGDRLAITAPAGRFVFDGRGADRIVLIAGGVGITPLMSITRYLTDTGWAGEIDFIFAARSRADIIFREELRLLETRFPNLHVRVILSRADGDPEWTGERGRLSVPLLKQWVADWQTAPVYVCGPQAMMDGMNDLLRELGTPAEHIHTEAFVSPANIDKPDLQTTSTQTAGNQAAAAVNGSAVEATIRFAKSGRETIAPSPQTVLEAAEEIGLDLPFECRAGICGQCKVRLARGRVVMDTEEALSPAEKKAGLILACQSHALEDLVVEA